MKVRAHSNVKNANAVANAQFNNYLMQQQLELMAGNQSPLLKAQQNIGFNSHKRSESVTTTQRPPGEQKILAANKNLYQKYNSKQVQLGYKQDSESQGAIGQIQMKKIHHQQKGSEDRVFKSNQSSVTASHKNVGQTPQQMPP